MELTNKKKVSRFLKINVIGISASGVRDLSADQQNLILSIEKIAGPKRILKDFQHWFAVKNRNKALPEFFPSDKPMELIKWLKDQSKEIVLFASGDPLWFGIGRTLLEHFSKDQLIFHPSPTSLQIAFSKLGMPWQDTKWVSLHGREAGPFLDLLRNKPKLIGVLIDPANGGAKEVQRILRANNLEENYFFWVFENLGHKNENIYKISPGKKIPKLQPLHLVVLIRSEEPFPSHKELPIFGIDDNHYLHHEDRPGLLTKKEVRVQILADLELPPSGVIWDIGAGVGSIGLEALRIRPNLKLLSIEKRLGGKDLIEKNAKRLSVHPAKIIEENAIEFLKKGNLEYDLATPSRVIVGGGNSSKLILLKEVINYILPKGIIIIPLATLEKLECVISLLKRKEFDVKISQHISFRGVPLLRGTRLNPINPVFIIKGQLQ